MTTLMDPTSTSGVDLGALAAEDRKIGRVLVNAEQSRQTALQRVAEQDAAADRKLRIREAKLDRAERRRQERAAAKERKRAEKRARWARIAAAVTAAGTYAQNNAAQVYCASIYGLAVGGAVYGQIDAAQQNGLPLPVGLITALAIEGTGLAMAKTALELRLQQERALVPRVLVWAATAAAVAINYFGHVESSEIKAYGLSLLSLIGITVWEVRSAAKYRHELRKKGALAQPPERFGWRRWVADLPGTWRAWRLDALQRVTPGAAALIASAAAVQAERDISAAEQRTERARRGAEQRADAERRQTRAQVAKAARTAARKAASKGEAGPALAALMYLAHEGTAPQQQALPAARRTTRPVPTRLVPTQPTPSAPAAAPVGEPTQALAAEPTRVTGDPGESTQAPQPAPVAPGHEPGSSTHGGVASRRAPVRRESARSVAASSGQRVTVTARTDEAALVAAYTALSTELGREPSGAQLAERAGVSKSTANRFKSNRGEA